MLEQLWEAGNGRVLCFYNLIPENSAILPIAIKAII